MAILIQHLLILLNNILHLLNIILEKMGEMSILINK